MTTERIFIEFVGAAVQSAWVGLVLIAGSALARRVSAPWRFAWLAAGLLRFALPTLPSPLRVSLPWLPGPRLESAPFDLAGVAWVLLALGITGAAVQFVRLARARIGLSRIVAAAALRDVPEALLDEARSAARALGVATPRIRMSDQVNAPLVVGLLRPTILVDEAWLTLDARDRQLVLLHELAHVKRRDLLWIELASWISVVWWWHPVFRLLVMQMRSAQEEACDDLALSVAPEHDRYCGMLLEVATRAATPVPAFAIAPLGFHGRTLEDRIRRLMNPHTRHAARVTARQWACVALVAASAFVAFGSHAMPQDTTSPRHLRLSLPHDHSHSHHH